MQHRGETLSPLESAELRALVERIGERQALIVLTISRQTLARAIGQMHIQRGTASMIRQRFTELKEAA
jgi:hypothetical protein